MNFMEILQHLQQAMAPQQQQPGGFAAGGFNNPNGAPSPRMPMPMPQRPSPPAPFGNHAGSMFPQQGGGFPQAPQAPQAQLPQGLAQPNAQGPQFMGSGIQRPQQNFAGPRPFMGPQAPQGMPVPQIGQGNLAELPNFQGSDSPADSLGNNSLPPHIQQLLQQMAVQGRQSPGVQQPQQHNRFSALMRAILPGV